MKIIRIQREKIWKLKMLLMGRTRDENEYKKNFWD